MEYSIHANSRNISMPLWLFHSRLLNTGCSWKADEQTLILIINAKQVHSRAFNPLSVVLHFLQYVVHNDHFIHHHVCKVWHVLISLVWIYKQYNIEYWIAYLLLLIALACRTVETKYLSNRRKQHLVNGSRLGQKALK